MPRFGSPHVYVPVALVLAIFLLPLLVVTPFYQGIIIWIFLNAALATAWNILGGFAGQLSLGHAAFFGLGAYTSTLLFVDAGVPPLAGVWIGALVAAVFALLIGYPCLTLRGPFFALATLAVAEVLRLVASSWRPLTRGSLGLFVPSQPGWANLVFRQRIVYVYVILAFTVAILAVTLWISRSPLGYRLRALREDEDAAEAIGIDTGAMKVGAFVVSAVITALCGTFYAQYFAFVDPDSVFSADLSVHIAMVAIIGGMGHPLGPAVGSLMLTPLQEFLRAWLGSAFQGFYGIVYGTALIVVVIALPAGVIGWIAAGFTRLLAICPDFSRSRDRPGPAAVGAVDGLGGRDGDGGEPILEVTRVDKRFGGLVAVHDVSLRIARGEVVGLIGPNGAGKTTLFNVIAGVHRPNAGSVAFCGAPLPPRRAPHLAARAGIARTFQIVKPFGGLSVLDNVLAAALLRAKGVTEARARSEQILWLVGLAGKRTRQAAALSLGDRKRLEIARALATRPRLLLLDEVMSGLTPAEVNEILALIARIKRAGTTVLMVEHMMRAIMTASDRIVVLHNGETIAEGAPAEVADDPRVIEVYLGRRYDAHHGARAVTQGAAE